MGAKLDSIGCNTFKDYQVSVHNVTRMVPKGMTSKLHDSMAESINVPFASKEYKLGY